MNQDTEPWFCVLRNVLQSNNDSCGPKICLNGVMDSAIYVVFCYVPFAVVVFDATIRNVMCGTIQVVQLVL